MLLIVLSVLIVAVTIKILRKVTSPKCTCPARLDGKTVLLIGGNAGIGKATALEIAKRGARLIIASRNVEKSKVVRDEIIALTRNTNIEVRHVDLQSLANVRKFAKDFIAKEARLDVLINNAVSINRGGGFQRTQDGNEVNMQVNHLGLFLLTNLLLDLLKSSAPSRIVVVSSSAHKLANHLLNPRDLNDLPTWPKIYSGIQVYAITKLCNMLMVKEMSKQLQGTGVTINGLHPGVVQTEAFEGLPVWLRTSLLWLTWPFYVGPIEGTQTTLHVAISPSLEKVSGKYFQDCKVAETSPMANDDEVARIVWETSLRMVGGIK